MIISQFPNRRLPEVKPNETKKLARESRPNASVNDHGHFKLWCDDIRPANLLINEDLQIVGVIDWEFTHAAPVEYPCGSMMVTP